MIVLPDARIDATLPAATDAVSGQAHGVDPHKVFLGSSRAFAAVADIERTARLRAADVPLEREASNAIR